MVLVDCLAFGSCHDIVALAEEGTTRAAVDSIWPPVAASTVVIPGKAETVAPAAGAIRIGIVGSTQCAANYDNVVCSGYTPFVTAQIVKFDPLVECSTTDNQTCWQITESARVDGGNVAWRQNVALNHCAQMCAADLACTGFTFSTSDFWGDGTTCEQVGNFRDESPAIVVTNEVRPVVAVQCFSCCF